MKKNLIGIQFDRDEICLAQMQRGELKLFSERMPDGIIQNGDVVSIETFASFLKDVKKRGQFKGSACAVVLPFSMYYFRSVSLPVMTESQLKLNLPYEFKDYIGDEAYKYHFDYVVKDYTLDEEGNPSSINLMAAAASNEAMARMASVLKKGGFTLEKAIPIEMAILSILRNAERNNAELESEECIYNIGTDNTIMCIIHNGKLAAFKIIDIGCRHIDAEIADIYGIDPYLAASYRTSNYENVLDNEKCMAVFERLGLEIMKTINFFHYENPEANLKSITVTGNCAWVGERTARALEYVGFNKKDIVSWKIGNVENDELAERCILAVGAALDYE